jgi:hypothetical protein
MTKLQTRFVHSLDKLKTLCLKAMLCPFCERPDSLNRHSLLYGNDPKNTQGQLIRGQRVICSPRGRRGGCGRTFSIFLDSVLPRHSVSTPVLWALLSLLLTGLSLKAAFESMGSLFCLETFYRLRQRLRHRLDVIRPLLCRAQKPPPCAQADPLLQTAAHGREVFAGVLCPFQEFQLRFQQPLMG